MFTYDSVLVISKIFKDNISRFTLKAGGGAKVSIAIEPGTTWGRLYTTGNLN